MVLPPRSIQPPVMTRLSSWCAELTIVITFKQFLPLLNIQAISDVFGCSLAPAVHFCTSA